ncbi:MAG: hypothetical protein DRP56_06550 [Planctomycetota bacterium]|nr:MAG: hypothetical protein DRP56_06550 [Planctomycetota bacterium]
MSQSQIDNRQEQAAQKLGVETSQVNRVRIELDALKENGILCQIHVHGTSMFSVRVRYDELGIGADDPRTERLRTGSKDLFPIHSKKLRSLEARARQNLVKHSFQVTAFGGYRWLPWTAYQDFIAKHKEITAELEQVKESACREWESIESQNREYFGQIAQRAWIALTSIYSRGDRAVVMTTDCKAFDLDDMAGFVNYVADRACYKMPSPDQIRREVKIDYQTAVLFSDSELAAERTLIEQEKAAQQQAQQAAEHARANRYVERGEQNAKIAAYKQAELEHARQQMAEMTSPLTDTLNALRGRIYEAVRKSIAGLHKSGGFKGRASSKVAGLFKLWKTLSGGLLKDDELEAALSELNTQMQGYQGATSREMQMGMIGDIQEQLEKIAVQTSVTAQEIAEAADSRAGNLEF